MSVPIKKSEFESRTRLYRLGALRERPSVREGVSILVGSIDTSTNDNGKVYLFSKNGESLIKEWSYALQDTEPSTAENNIGYITGFDREAVALNLNTGEEIFSYGTGGAGNGVTVWNEKIAVYAHETLTGLDPFSGEVIWEVDGDTVSSPSAAVMGQNGDVFFISAPEGVRKYDALTGDLLEENGVLGSGTTPPTIGEDRVYAYVADEGVKAFDRDTLSTEWTSAASLDRTGSRSIPIVEDDTVYYKGQSQNFEGFVAALETDTGSVVWEDEYADSDYAATRTVYESGHVFGYANFNQLDNEIYGINADNGNTEWIYQGDGPAGFSASIDAYNGVLYAGQGELNNPDGTLHAIDIETGAKITTAQVDEQAIGWVTVVEDFDAVGARNDLGSPPHNSRFDPSPNA